jgi:hypothetical protein
VLYSNISTVSSPRTYSQKSDASHRGRNDNMKLNIVSQLHLLLWESINYYAYLLTIPRPRHHDKVVWFPVISYSWKPFHSILWSLRIHVMHFWKLFFSFGRIFILPLSGIIFVVAQIWYMYRAMHLPKMNIGNFSKLASIKNFDVYFP